MKILQTVLRSKYTFLCWECARTRRNVWMCTYSAIPRKLSGSWTPGHSQLRYILLQLQDKCPHTKLDCNYRFTTAYLISGQLPPSQIHWLESPLLLIKYLFNHCSNIWPSLLADNIYGQTLGCLWMLCLQIHMKKSLCMREFISNSHGHMEMENTKTLRRLRHPIPMRIWMPRYLWKTLS